MYRFKREHWVNKWIDHRPQEWTLSSSVVGQFDSDNDHLQYRTMHNPRDNPSQYAKRKHKDDVTTHVSDSLNWESPLFDYPTAGVKSSCLQQKYGKMKPSDNRFTPVRKYKAHPGVRLKPVENHSVGKGLKSDRSLSPNISETSRTTNRSSLPPLQSTRSEGGETAWNFRYRTPWKDSRQDGSLSSRNPNYQTPGWN